MTMHFSILRAPYPVSSPWSHLRRSLGIGFFVFAFLFFFQPFGMYIEPMSTRAIICFGYGLITFLSMMVFTALFRWMFLDQLNPQNWTLGKEIAYSLGVIWVIGLFNLLYSAWIFSFPLGLGSFFAFQAYTLGIGLFPVLAATYLNFNRKNQLHLNEAQTLNHQLHVHPPKEMHPTEKLAFSSASQEPGWELSPDQFLFAETADNYVQLYALTEEGIERRILRSTLRTVEEEAHDFPFLVRTHRSFFVNLHKVQSFSGNAQGLKLQLQGIDREIPVSRKLVDEIREKLG